MKTDAPNRPSDFNAIAGQRGGTAAPRQTGAANLPTLDKRPKHPPPFSVRFSADEREWLRQQVKDGSIGAFIRRRTLAKRARDAKGKTWNGPTAEQKEIAQILAQLGRSTLASNVNQLAKAVHTGTLDVGPQTEAALRQACVDIAAMRTALLKALRSSSVGISKREARPPPVRGRGRTTAHTFAEIPPGKRSG